MLTDGEAHGAAARVQPFEHFPEHRLEPPWTERCRLRRENFDEAGHVRALRRGGQADAQRERGDRLLHPFARPNRHRLAQAPDPHGVDRQIAVVAACLDIGEESDSVGGTHVRSFVGAATKVTATSGTGRCR